MNNAIDVDATTLKEPLNYLKRLVSRARYSEHNKNNFTSDSNAPYFKLLPEPTIISNTTNSSNE